MEPLKILVSDMWKYLFLKLCLINIIIIIIIFNQHYMGSDKHYPKCNLELYNSTFYL